MPDQLPPCPACAESFTYEQGALLVCPMCGHEWSADEASDTDSAPVGTSDVKDSVGNILADGDTVIVATTVKVKAAVAGSSRRAPRSVESGSLPMASAITTSTRMSPASVACSSSRVW